MAKKQRPQRLPVEKRAGSRMGKNAVPIHGDAKVSGGVHGLLDLDSGVFQCGGEENDFTYWREGLISISMRVWNQIKDKALYMEWVDHTRNRCWRIDIATARDYGKKYNAGIGERYGVPRMMCQVLDGPVTPFTHTPPPTSQKDAASSVQNKTSYQQLSMDL